jgi:hypothetical protein
VTKLCLLLSTWEENQAEKGQTGPCLLLASALTQAVTKEDLGPPVTTVNLSCGPHGPLEAMLILLFSKKPTVRVLSSGRPEKSWSLPRPFWDIYEVLLKEGMAPNPEGMLIG